MKVREVRAAIGPRPMVAAGLVVAAAVMNGAESIGMRLLLPPEPDTKLEALHLVAENRPAYTALILIGTLAVPLMASAFWILTGLARDRTPRLAMTARGLLMAGMWGFLGVHVVSMTQVPLSAGGSQEAGAAALTAIEGSPVMGLVFLLPFLVGCSLGLLLLAVALLRSAFPRWVPLTMLAFLIVDFGLRNPGPVDAHWLWIAASIGAARFVVRRPAAEPVGVESSPRAVVGA
jgi:hypothetical protein